MLEISDREIEPVIAALAALGVDAGYLVPTPTGLIKYTLDAHGGLRDFLKLKGVHDYGAQPQGKPAKRVVKAFFVTPSGYLPTRASMYRPVSKDGDPRIWFRDLGNQAKPGNLLAVLVHQGDLFVVNVSDLQMLSSTGSLHPIFDDLVTKIAAASNVVAIQLLNLLKPISALGWVPTLRKGPTGVGYTLETMLGIKANSSKRPDYKGIELKAARYSASGVSSSRTTLFSKTPDWERSNISSGLELLNAYGYVEDGRRQLYCTLDNSPNSKGHFLDVQDHDVSLRSLWQPSDASPPKQVFYWDMDLLRTCLADKHRETFWVKAKKRTGVNGEEFHYTEVVHTKGPLLGNVVEMFRLGRLYLDYAIHENFNKKGKPVARDHGYLFKMWQSNLPNLFPPPKTYIL